MAPIWNAEKGPFVEIHRYRNSGRLSLLRIPVPRFFLRLGFLEFGDYGNPDGSISPGVVHSHPLGLAVPGGSDIGGPDVPKYHGPFRRRDR